VIFSGTLLQPKSDILSLPDSLLSDIEIGRGMVVRQAKSR
jgi:hypothetical protein